MNAYQEAIKEEYQISSRSVIQHAFVLMHKPRIYVICGIMEIGKFNLIKTEGRARRGEFCTAHGVVQTPVFQNVGTAGAIKGAVDAFDLKELGCQIELSNTYHLHVRPGDQIVTADGRPAQVHALGRSDADRLRRLSGVFACDAAQDQGGRRDLPLAR